MKTNVEVNSKYTKTYKTREKAVEAADKMIAKYETWAPVHMRNTSPRFIVSATPCGQFSPIFINTGSDMMFFVDKKFMVAG